MGANFSAMFLLWEYRREESVKYPWVGMSFLWDFSWSRCKRRN